MRKLNCPNCNANLEVDDNNRDFAFCQYCGTKIMLDDYRSTHRVVDEARIKEAELEKEIRLKELEIEERELERSRKGRKTAYTIAAVLLVVGGLSEIIDPLNLFGSFVIMAAMIVFLYTHEGAEKSEERRKMRSGMIKLTSDIIDYEKKDYRILKSLFEDLGFKNIKTVNMYDLRTGFLIKPGLVGEVKINGQSISISKWYNPNDQVVIMYHGLCTDN